VETIIKTAVNKNVDDSLLKVKKGDSRADKEIEDVLSSHTTKISVIGAGGAGNNTLSRLTEVGIRNANTIAINTDAQDLLYTNAGSKILIGKEATGGLGAGSNPKVGEDAAKEAESEIKAAIAGSDMVFITCGLGGGTGTGSVPVVAELAKKAGALTIAVVTLPFTVEGMMRWENARSGLERLRKATDTVILIPNDKLLELVPELPLNTAFKVADEILVNAVRGITELVTEEGLVNLDFADIRAIMKDGGTAMIGLGESDTENRAVDAVEKALMNPLLDVDVTGAKGALINITGGADMTLKDARIVMESVSDRLDPAARVIWGARLDKELQNLMRVLLVVTGLKPQAQILPGGKTATKAEKKTQMEEEYGIDFVI